MNNIFIKLITVLLLFSTTANAKIKLYMSGPSKMIHLLERGFEKKHGDVLDVYVLGSGVLRQKVWTELNAHSIQADVISSSTPLTMIALKEKKQLLKYIPTNISKLSADVNIGDGYFIPTSQRYIVLFFNSEKVNGKSIPVSWADLNSSFFKRKVALADASKSAMGLGIAYGLYSTVYKNDWTFFKKLKAQGPALLKKNIAAINKVESGESIIGIGPYDGVFKVKKKAKKNNIKSALKIAWPKEGALSVQTSIGIIDKKVRSIEDTNIAKRFLDFTLSKKYQKIIEKFGLLSVLKKQGVESGKFKNKKVLTVNWLKLSQEENTFREQYKKIMHR